VRRGTRSGAGWPDGSAAPAVLPVAAVLVLIAALVSSCGGVRLVDPTVVGIPAAGVVVNVGIFSGRGGTRFEFQGYVYGYEDRAGDWLVRYLDAGSVVVGGHVAERQYVRVGEPVYRARVSEVVARPEAAIRIGGSEVVAGCGFDVVLPVVLAPGAGAVIHRDRALELPFLANPDALETSRVRARVLVPDDASGTYWIELVPRNGVLVIPSDFLARVPVGTRELTLRIDMERTLGDSDPKLACAPSLIARSWFEHRVEVRFE